MLKAIAISATAYAALKASAEARGMVLRQEPRRSPYGHIYVWLDHSTQKALEAIRRPSEGLSEAILRLAAEEDGT